jgi:hypothetical protein
MEKFEDSMAEKASGVAGSLVGDGRALAGELRVALARAVESGRVERVGDRANLWYHVIAQQYVPDVVGRGLTPVSTDAKFGRIDDFDEGRRLHELAVRTVEATLEAVRRADGDQYVSRESAVSFWPTLATTERSLTDGVAANPRAVLGFDPRILDAPTAVVADFGAWLDLLDVVHAILIASQGFDDAAQSDAHPVDVPVIESDGGDTPSGVDRVEVAPPAPFAELARNYWETARVVHDPTDGDRLHRVTDGYDRPELLLQGGTTGDAVTLVVRQYPAANADDPVDRPADPDRPSAGTRSLHIRY